MSKQHTVWRKVIFMVVMEQKPELDVRSASEAQLEVERTDISFHDVANDRVRVQVTVRNTGTGRSRPTPMRIESAPLGAFVPWRPLAHLIVPALEPGESHEVSTEAVRPRPIALGDFGRVPPKRLLTAVSSADQPAGQPGVGVAALLNLFGKRRSVNPSRRDVAGRGSLAPDLWDLIGRGQPHWAGNINVFVGPRSVERHLARALRVYPGRTNLAMFIVGNPGKPDAYAFELVGLSLDWEIRLYDVSNNRNLLVNPSHRPIGEKEWVDADGSMMVVLAMDPPEACRTGNLQVHVTRRSRQETAIVEFNLDPAAQGAGCYFA